MGMVKRQTKLAVLTNIIAPYRLPLFSLLAEQFDLLILHGGKEANRDSWSNLEHALSKAKVVRAWGWQIRLAKKVNGEVFDEKFIHITPGLIWNLLRFRPDAVISNEMGFRSVVALAYGALFRKPVWIWWEGTLHSERNIDPLRRLLRKAFVLGIDHWISFGNTSTEHLLGLGVKRDRILQLQNAVDEERFQAPVEPGWAIEPRPVVLYVGQLIERKGVRLLLDAAATVQQNGRDFSLLLVGSGRDKEALQNRANALGLRNVHFLPAQPPERMPAVYRSADLVVLPTLEDVWGLVANEAILSGVPVLCSKYAGCAAELLSPEHLFAPDDAQEFSQKLEAAICGGLSKADPARLKTIPQLGDELVREIRRWLPPAPVEERSKSTLSSDATVQSPATLQSPTPSTGGTRQPAENVQ
jgi:glycosyltransferase involved in cell wall biosynthesis